MDLITVRNMAAVVKFFGISPKEWRRLSEQDKADLKAAVQEYNTDNGEYTGPGTY
jgi:hypothetical protein